MATARREPTGVRREVPPHDLFFSTTDRKGVIDSANSVFVRLSRYTEPQLLGAPHNIIRHPEMPAGVFHIMWERLLAGRSVATYVRNLAADGADYWTFATVTPLGEGFLSVRSAVSRQDLWEAVDRVYAVSLRVEREARAAGEPAASAARIGAEALEVALRNVGFDDFEDAMRHLLPAEVAARVAAAPHTSATHAAGALGTIMTSATVIEGELEGLLARLESYLDLAAHAKESRERIAPIVASLVAASEAATGASTAVAETAPTLSRAADAATHLAAQSQAVLGELADDLAAMREAVLELRVVIALSSMHNSMALSFARAVAMRDEGNDAFDRVERLCGALKVSLDDTELMLQSVREKLARVAAHISDVHEQLHSYQRMLAQWRNLVARFAVGGALAAHIAPIDAQLAAGLDQMLTLRELGDRALQMAEPVPIDRLRDALFAMHTAVSAGGGTRR